MVWRWNTADVHRDLPLSAAPWSETASPDADLPALAQVHLAMRAALPCVHTWPGWPRLRACLPRQRSCCARVPSCIIEGNPDDWCVVARGAPCDDTALAYHMAYGRLLTLYAPCGPELVAGHRVSRRGQAMHQGSALIASVYTSTGDFHRVECGYGATHDRDRALAGKCKRTHSIVRCHT